MSKLFNGDRLRIARQRRGFTKANLADKLNLTPRTITGWEAQEYAPDDENLTQLSSFLEFPKSFFQLESATANVSAETISFRSFARKTARQRDAVIAMCDLTYDIGGWLHKKFNFPQAQLPNYTNFEPEMAANSLRQEWEMGNKPIGNIINLVEAKGIRVLALAENCKEIDACSYWINDVPYILLNTDRNTERSRFNIAHELAHLVLHKNSTPTGKSIEKEANLFASNFLIPKASIHASDIGFLDLSVIIEKKKFWRVSVLALIYRFNQLGMISEWQFRALMIEAGRQGYRESEPASLPKETSKVLEYILETFKEKNISLTYVANEISIPESELKSLFNGLTTQLFNTPSLKIVK